MTITDLCIRRPVLATVLNLMLVLVGVIAYDRLTVREYPKIDEPVVTVETSYPGASAEIMESQVTKPLEDSLAGIEGIEVMTSISRQEQSQISLRFKLDRDPDNAAADVRDRVGRVRQLLPDEVDEPVIAKVEADAQPIIWLAFSSDQHNAMEISDYADRYVKDRLQNLNGVADVRIFGERRMSMRLWQKPDRLAAYRLTPQDVEDALRAQNVEVPAGRIESAQREFTVVAETDLSTPEEFEEMIVARQGDRVVRFKDIGRAEIAPEDVRRSSRFNGREAVALGVVKQATANPLEVSDGVKAIFPIIEKNLPAGMEIQVAYDSSVFIERSIEGVFTTIVEAVVLVVLVIFIFLRSVRSTLVPMITIPISLVGVFMMMYMLDFSINTLTLLSMVLAIGLVVDDAIVMLENIYRYIEEGMQPIDAALKGAREIAFAVIAMTITLAAVYAPVAFMEGRTGKLFTEFALTLAGAVLISGFIALTLSPMMCSRLLKHETRHGKFYHAIESALEWVQTSYARALDKALVMRWRVVGAGVAVAAAGVVLFTLLPSELSPIEDRGTVVVIGVAPEGSTLGYTADWMAKLEPIFNGVPEIEKYFVIGGFPVVSQGIAFVRLSEWETRARKQQDIVAELQPKVFGGIPGIMAFPVNPPSLGRSPVNKPVEFVVLTSGTYAELNEAVAKLMAKVQTNPNIISLDTDLKLNKPEIRIDVERDKTSLLGVDVATLGRTLETMLGGRQVTRFKRHGEEYDVIVQVEDALRTSPTDISGIYVRAGNGEMVQLSNLITLQETVAPRELNHFNQMRAAKITANVAPGYTLGEALDFLNQAAQETLDPHMLVDYDGESREFRESSSTLMVTFLLALIFIYLVLAAQFESFASPFIIMMTVPLSMTGALLALYLTGGTLSIYSQMGLITLIGLITKHGILIVEFANHGIAEGKGVTQAVRDSALLRLRPILMTTGAMVLGAAPLALASGAGAESRAQIGWVIIGGMTLGTFFTLFVIPVVYALAKGGKAPSSPHALGAHAEASVPHVMGK